MLHLFSRIKNSRRGIRFLTVILTVAALFCSPSVNVFAMSENHAKMYDYIAEEISQNHVSQVDISRFHIHSEVLSYEEAYSRSYQTQLEFRHPELYYVQIKTGSWNPYTEEESTMTVRYLMSEKEIRSSTQKYNRILDGILAKAEKEKSLRKQVAVVNREICRICSYDQTGGSPHDNDAYGCLVKRKAVCSGYALAAAACFNRLGIENSFVYSYKKNHVWNKVKIGGKWYQVDICWNDRGKTASTEYLLKSHLANH